MAESFKEGAKISEVARRNGVSGAAHSVATPSCGGGRGQGAELRAIQIGTERGGGGQVGSLSVFAGTDEAFWRSPRPPRCGVVDIVLNGAHIRDPSGPRRRRFRCL